MTARVPLHILLHPPFLALARAGRLDLVRQLRGALVPRGWAVTVEAASPAALAAAERRPGYLLVDRTPPPHERALTLRLAYHRPWWRIERQAERWRWPVALARFDPAGLSLAESERFVSRLRARVLPGPPPTQGTKVLIPLQGRLRDERSFQTMSPLAMVEAVAATGRPVVATPHPRHPPTAAERAALDRLASRFGNLTVGGDSAARLRDCAFVATMNSAVAFDAMILGKPVVLFAQADFHHIALNVADVGVAEALRRAPGHRPDHARYVDWFLRGQAVDAGARGAGADLVGALRRHGWPV